MTDPRFFDDLQESIREKKTPVGEVSKHLQIKLLPNYLKQGYKFSFIINLFFITCFALLFV
jgi:hypothetical protein